MIGMKSIENKSNKTIISSKIDSLAITFALIILLIFLFTPSSVWAKKKKEAEKSSSTKIKLTITSDPLGATVAVDRAIQGNTPLTLELTPGEHIVRVSLDENWIPFIDTRNFEQDYELKVTLKRTNEYSYQLGKEAFAQGDYTGSREYLKESLNTQGKIQPDALFFLGVMDYKEKKFEDMEKNLRNYIQQNPPSGDFVKSYPELSSSSPNWAVFVSHFLIGGYYQEGYKWGEAATMYKLSIPSYKDFIDKEMKVSYDNIKILRDKVNKNPGDIKSLFQLGYLYEMKGMLFQSMMSYRDGAVCFYSQSAEFETDFQPLAGSLFIRTKEQNPPPQNKNNDENTDE